MNKWCDLTKDWKEMSRDDWTRWLAVIVGIIVRDDLLFWCIRTVDCDSTVERKEWPEADEWLWWLLEEERVTWRLSLWVDSSGGQVTGDEKHTRNKFWTQKGILNGVQAYYYGGNTKLQIKYGHPLKLMLQLLSYCSNMMVVLPFSLCQKFVRNINPQYKCWLHQSQSFKLIRNLFILVAN